MIVKLFDSNRFSHKQLSKVELRKMLMGSKKVIILEASSNIAKHVIDNTILRQLGEYKRDRLRNNQKRRA